MNRVGYTWELYVEIFLLHKFVTEILQHITVYTKSILAEPVMYRYVLQA
jgi:hypothetical protein